VQVDAALWNPASSFSNSKSKKSVVRGGKCGKLGGKTLKFGENL